MDGLQEEPAKLQRRLRWWDGLALGMASPVSILAAVGGSIVGLGVWGSVALWATASIIGALQSTMYAEMAAMFPDKPGVAMYAHQAWKRYCEPLGAVVAIGYWMGWSLSLGVYGLLIGELLQARFFPGQTWTFSTGTIDAGLPHLIGAATILAVWLLNVYGLRMAVWTNWVIIAVLVVFFGAFFIAPFTGDWSSETFTSTLTQDGMSWDTMKIAIVWLYLMMWTTAGSEAGATFAPEYKSVKYDAPRALVATAAVGVLIATLLPLGSAGLVGEQAVADDPIGYFIGAFSKVVGHEVSGLVVVAICVALFLAMNGSTADAGRALYGIAQERMTIKQLGKLNHQHLPANAMTLDLFANLGILFFIGNPIGILFASNVGYLIALLFGVGAFVLLRKDRPTWPRPVKLPRIWIGVAAIVFVVDAVCLVVGASNPGLAGYADAGVGVLYGIGILVIALCAYAYRRIVQDKGRMVFRDLSEPAPPVVDADGNMLGSTVGDDRLSDPDVGATTR